MTTETAAPETPRETRLFTRKASGLVRELGLPAAIGIALASVVLVNAFIIFGAGLTSFAKADFILPLVLAAGIWLVALFAYKYLIQAIPRAGGEYVYLSRIISPALGAMAGIAVVAIWMYAVASSNEFAAQFTPFMLTGLGAAFHSASIANAATHVTGQTATLLISLGVLAIVGALSLLPVRILARTILGLVMLQLLAFLVLGVILATHSHGDFVAAFGRYSHHPNAYSSILSAAHKNGIVVGASLAAMLGVIPFMVLNYNGVLYSYYVGGELKRPVKTYVSASAIGLGILAVVWIGIWILMRHTVGLHFMQAQANLGASNPTAYGNITQLPSVAGGLGYGMVLSGDPITKILFATAVPFAEIAVDLAIIAVMTRVLFALAFDRLLPLGLAKVNERTHSPIRAIAVALVATAGITVLVNYVNIASIVANISLFFALILLAGSVAAAALPLRRRDLVLKPGARDVERWFGVPKITVIGLASTALATLTVVLILSKPSVFGGFSAESVAADAIVLLAGPVVYFIARTVRRRRSSLDLGLALRELPPE
jgi:amino acid transporter